MTIQELEANHYHKQKVSKKEIYKLADYIYWKTPFDDTGKAYTIDMYVYDYTLHPSIPINTINIMPVLYFRTAHGDREIILNTDEMSLLEIEQEADNLWNFYGRHYMSKWEAE